MQFSNLNFTLTSSSGAQVAATFAYNLSTNAVTLTPAAALAYGTTYTATVSGAVDAAGDPMTAPFNWSFTTAASSAVAPTVNSETPAPGATNVAVSSPVTATFNTAVQPSAITFILKTPGGATVPASVTYNSSDTIATLTPSAALAYATTYTLTLNGAQNSSGNSPVTWSFSTVGPTIVSVGPPASANGVAASYAVYATFNESIQAGSITASDFTLKTASGAVVLASISYNASTNTATLTPTLPLAWSATYTVSISGATDSSGHTMANALTWSFTTAPAALAGILSTLNIPVNPLYRLWWTPARIQEAQVWWKTNAYVPESDDPEGNAFAYLMTGNIQYGMAAVSSITNISILASELEGVSSNNYKWQAGALEAFSWCYNLLTPTQITTFISEYNNYTQILLAKSWGGPGMEGNNYYWGYFGNALNWALDSYYINPMAPTFLYDIMVTRWQDGVLPYFAGGDAGGVPPEGSEYFADILDFELIPFETMKLMGDDVVSQTQWYQAAAYWVIYDTSPSPIDGSYAGFPFEDDEDSNGIPAFTTFQVYGDFMTMVANEWPTQPIGEYARQWLNITQTSVDPWVAAVDPGGTALSYTNLPLDYYAPGMSYVYSRTSWAPGATAVLLQLGESSAASHQQLDMGAFQIEAGSQQLAIPHTGYVQTFADGTSSELTSAHNGLLYNNVGQAQYDQAGPPQVLALESTPTLTYAVDDLTNTYLGSSGYGNASAGHTVREFIFIKPLDTLFVVDRMASSSVSVTQSFLLHTPGSPTIVNSNDVTFTSGNEELFLTTVPTAGSHSYSVSNEGDEGSTDVYRLQDNYTGVQDNVLLHAITIGPPGSDPVSVAITGQTASTWTITFTSATLGTAVLVLNNGTFSLGGSFGYAASGTPVLSPLTNSVQTITVTSNGPVWGAVGSGGTAGVANVAMGVATNATDSVASNAATASKASGGTSIPNNSSATATAAAAQSSSAVVAAAVTPSTWVYDAAIEAISSESDGSLLGTVTTKPKSTQL